MSKLIVGVNDLATLRSDLARQLVDPSLAKTVTLGSGASLEWFCLGTNEQPHPRFEWTCWVAHRVSGRGCPACKGKAVIVGWNDLATTHPNLAAQLVTLDDALGVTAGSKRRLNWKCLGTKGRPHPRYEWTAQVANRVNGRGCPACSGKAVVVGWNDLATTHPSLAAQLVHPDEALTITAGSNTHLGWQCSGTAKRPHPRYEWSAIVVNRVNGRGCSACSGKAVIIGWNDLATTHPHLAAQLVNQDDALAVSAGSNSHLDWHCSGTAERPHPRYEWSAEVVNRVNGRGCSACSKGAILVGWNDFATTHPELTAQLVNPSLAISYTAGSGTALEWWCSGTDDSPHPYFTWSASISSRSNPTRPTGCPACAGKAVIIGWNDLGTTHPSLAESLVDQSLATSHTAGSSIRALWWCEGDGIDRHDRIEWTAVLSSRASGSGCSLCKKGAYNPLGEGWVYRGLFRHGKKTALFFGRSTSIDARARHYLGALTDVTELIAYRVGNGREATRIETELNRLLESVSLQSCRDAGLLVNGLSESFYLDDCGADFLSLFDSTFAEGVASATEVRVFRGV